MLKKPSNLVVRVWVCVGLLAYVALPWYAADAVPLSVALGGIFGGPDTANGVAQALVHGRKWVLVGAMGLMLALIAIGQRRRRAQAMTLVAGGLLGIAAVVVTGPMAREGGPLHDVFVSRFGEAAASQPALGAGAWVVVGALAALAVLGFRRLAVRAPQA